MNNLNKKIVELKIDETIDLPLSVISFVEYPAIEENFLMFSMNVEKKEIVGIALKANKMIERLNKDKNIFYVYFTKDVVKKAKDEFEKALDKKYNFNLEHNKNDIVNDVKVLKSWIVEDENDESNSVYNLGAEVNDWCIHLKITSEETWQLIKENANGFSIEIATSYFHDAKIEAENIIYNQAAEYLFTLDENIDEYDLVDDEMIVENDIQLAKTIPNTNNTTSEQNKGLYKILFKYNGEIKENSREFCKKMIAKNGLYSKENIDKASTMIVNSGFGAGGANTYDIFTYAGGVACHHNWVKQVYFRKRAKGQFLPNNKLNNDELIDGVTANKIGIVNDLPNETIKPINLPKQGRI